MKPSGIDVIGDIPAPWEVKPLRLIGRILKGVGGSKEDAVEQGIPCVRYGDLYTTHGEVIEESRTYLTEERAVAYTPIRYGDLLFAASGEKLEEIGKSAVNLIHGEARCGGDMIVLRPSVPVVPRFLGYATNAAPSVAQKTTMGRGTTVKHIYPAELRNLAIPIPPIDQQAIIADFLARRTAAIDALIAKQEQLLALLAEKRQALITQAVTKGLDPNVPMKHSGVDWIGEVPAHWSVAALSTRYQIDLGKMLSPEVANGPYPLPYLGNQHVRWDHVVVDDLPTMSIDPSERERYTLRPGDLLVCEGGEVGRTAMWRGELDVCAYQKALHRLRARNDGDVARYLYFALVTAAGLGVFEAEGNRSTFVHLTSEKLRRHRFPFPPTAEQAKIAEYLDREAGRLDTLSQRVQAMIEKLREYRQALITAAVTGQLDVTPTIHSERRPSPQAEAV